MKKATILNATPHPITVGDQTFQPSGHIARVTMHTDVVGTINGFEIVQNMPSSVEGIPAQEDGVYWIVSAMVLANSTRSDLIAPDTNRATRNEQGHIISVPGFVK